MNEITAILVDDEELSLYHLSNLISKFCPEVRIVYRADSVVSAVKFINLLKPDMVFMDINLNDGTGFDVFEQTGNLDYETVFVTASDKFGVKAIEYSALNYLLKPIVVEQLVDCVIRYKNKNLERSANQMDVMFKLLKKNTNRLILPDIYGFKVVDINEVIRCEADSCYTHFYIKDGSEITVSKPLSNFNDILPNHLFYRVHSKHLVNLNCVKQYVKGRSGRIILENNEEIVVAESKKKEFLERLKQLAHSLPDKK